MDRFKALQTFLDVAKTESLSAVAREEGVTPAMVGRRIDQLEARMGVKLFKRSTPLGDRSVALWADFAATGQRAWLWCRICRTFA